MSQTALVSEIKMNIWLTGQQLIKVVLSFNSPVKNVSLHFGSHRWRGFIIRFFYLGGKVEKSVSSGGLI